MSRIGANRRSGSPTGLICRDHKQSTAVDKRSAWSSIGQSEADDGAGNGLMILILYFDNRFSRGAFLDVVDGAVTLNNHDLQERTVPQLAR